MTDSPGASRGRAPAARQAEQREELDGLVDQYHITRPLAPYSLHTSTKGYLVDRAEVRADADHRADRGAEQHGHPEVPAVQGVAGLRTAQVRRLHKLHISL